MLSTFYLVLCANDLLVPSFDLIKNIFPGMSLSVFKCHSVPSFYSTYIIKECLEFGVFIVSTNRST